MVQQTNTKQNNYSVLLEKAMSYYEHGRAGDVEHVKWLYETIQKYISKDEINHDILMPVAILHDVGYSMIPKGSDSYNLDIRKAHSEYGADIAEKILTEIKYPENKIKEIKRLILKHDNWAFGDSFIDEPVLLAFNNYDFMWMASEKGFDICRTAMHLEPQEAYRKIEQFQQENINRRSKWFNGATEELYNKLMDDRRKKVFS
jgi:hypothetical protein